MPTGVGGRLTGLRLAAVAALAAMASRGGWAHPIALLAGYTVLPLALVVQGLRRRREETLLVELIEHPPIFRLPGHSRPRDLHVDRDGRSWPALAFVASRNVAAGAARHAELPGGRARAVPADDRRRHRATRGGRYLPLIATLGLFILVSNLMGLVPGHGGADRRTSTPPRRARSSCSSPITGSASASRAASRTSSTSRGRCRWRSSP